MAKINYHKYREHRRHAADNRRYGPDWADPTTRTADPDIAQAIANIEARKKQGAYR